MSSYLRSLIGLFSTKVPSKVLKVKTCRKASIPKPCIKNATKETKEIGWMQQPVVKNPPRFRVELASSSDCKFASFLACHTVLITEQDPVHLYSNNHQNSKSEKPKHLSPIDEFIRATSFKTNFPNNFDGRIKNLGKTKPVLNMNKEISKFQYEQSRLQRKTFTKSCDRKCQPKSAESLPEPILAPPPPENHKPSPGEVLLFLPFKAKVTAGSGNMQTGTSKTDKKYDANSKHFHRKPIIYKKNAWLNGLQLENWL